MSSLYRAEQLTWRILKELLNILKNVGSVTVNGLHDRLGDKFSEIEDIGQEISRITNEARRSGYIARTSNSPDAVVSITQSGGQRLLSLLEDEAFNKLDESNWDGKWRILTYDIPESNRSARDAIRRLIRQLGFKNLHQSVWVLPYDCVEQIQVIQNNYGVHEHISLLIVDGFDRSLEYEDKFKLS